MDCCAPSDHCGDTEAVGIILSISHRCWHHCVLDPTLSVAPTATGISIMVSMTGRLSFFYRRLAPTIVVLFAFVHRGVAAILHAKETPTGSLSGGTTSEDSAMPATAAGFFIIYNHCGQPTAGPWTPPTGTANPSNASKQRIKTAPPRHIVPLPYVVQSAIFCLGMFTQ